MSHKFAIKYSGSFILNTWSHGLLLIISVYSLKVMLVNDLSMSVSSMFLCLTQCPIQLFPLSLSLLHSFQILCHYEIVVTPFKTNNHHVTSVDQKAYVNTPNTAFFSLSTICGKPVKQNEMQSSCSCISVNLLQSLRVK